MELFMAAVGPTILRRCTARLCPPRASTAPKHKSYGFPNLEIPMPDTSDAIDQLCTTSDLELAANITEGLG